MDRLIPIGRAFFSVALVGLGIEHSIFQEFITGRAPAWPESIAGGPIWAYLTGMVFIVVGVTILSGKKARPAAFLAATLIFFWALLRHVPVVAADSFLSGAWTRAGKAMTFVGGVFRCIFSMIGPAGASELGRLKNRGEDHAIHVSYYDALIYIMLTLKQDGFVFLVAMAWAKSRWDFVRNRHFNVVT